jgi:hypothetical protein
MKVLAHGVLRTWPRILHCSGIGAIGHRGCRARLHVDLADLFHRGYVEAEERRIFFQCPDCGDFNEVAPGSLPADIEPLPHFEEWQRRQAATAVA